MAYLDSKNSDSDPGSNPIIVLCTWDVILILALQCEKFCILQCSHFVSNPNRIRNWNLDPGR